MTEQLRPKPSDRVLEVGTGSGYQAAILAELVSDVYSIEIVEPLAKGAEATLQRLGSKNVPRKIGIVPKGWPTTGQFFAFSLSFAPGKIPPPLFVSLNTIGARVIPAGDPVAMNL